MTMVFYKGNVRSALLDLFPNIGLDPSKLQGNDQLPPSSMLQTTLNRDVP